MAENLKQILTGLDVTPLLEAVDRHPELWQENTVRQSTPGSAHTDTETIFLRWAKENTVQSVFDDTSSVDMPALQKLPEFKDFVDSFMSLFGPTELGRVLIVSLKPGGFIKPHADEGAYSDHFERFHVCLKSEDGNAFLVEERKHHTEVVSMQPGEAWWFNHKKVHCVRNGSAAPRIHLIIDAVVPKYRRERDAISA